MSQYFKFDHDVIENDYLCPDCGEELWNKPAHEPGEALGTDERGTGLFCLNCHAPVGEVQYVEASVSHVVRGLNAVS